MSSDKIPRVLDCLARAGFSIIAGVDMDKYALATYANIHGSKKAILEDASIFLSDITSYDNCIDVIVGGPPCQWD